MKKHVMVVTVWVAVALCGSIIDGAQAQYGAYGYSDLTIYGEFKVKGGCPESQEGCKVTITGTADWNQSCKSDQSTADQCKINGQGLSGDPLQLEIPQVLSGFKDKNIIKFSTKILEGEFPKPSVVGCHAATGQKVPQDPSTVLATALDLCFSVYKNTNNQQISQGFAHCTYPPPMVYWDGQICTRTEEVQYDCAVMDEWSCGPQNPPCDSCQAFQ